MFYARGYIDDNAEISVDVNIYPENVYTICPRCGKEHNVCLSCILKNGGDLERTSVYCKECSERIAGKPLEDNERICSNDSELSSLIVQ